MPLEHGKSKGAFKHNVKAEMHAGRPLKQSLAIAYSMKKKKKMAQGGYAEEKLEYDPTEEPGVEHNAAAMHEDDMDLNQHGESDEGPEGGDGSLGRAHDSPPDEGEQTDAHDMDMISQIMAKRTLRMSAGGRVANRTDHEEDTDMQPAQYDDLANRDDLEDHYTGENSGDEDGNEQEDRDREDIVSRIMKQRKLRGRNPNPAD